MSKPVNQKQKRREYLLIGFVIYFMILYISLHIGYVNATLRPGENILLMTLDHLENHPFQIFPLHLDYLPGAFLCGMIAPMMAYTEYLKKRDLRPSIENGSAKWNDDIPGFLKTMSDQKTSDLESSEGEKSKSEKVDTNMIMTKHIKVSMNPYKTERNNNLMIFGGAGTGKSRGVIKPNIMQMNCCYVITDPSGELYSSMADLLRENHYEVRTFNLNNMEASGHYNPFDYVKNEKDIVTLMTSLMSSTTNKHQKSNDPFWERAETALIQACCLYLYKMDIIHHTHKASFEEVMKLLQLAKADEGQQSELDQKFAFYENEYGSDFATETFKVFQSAGGGKTANTIVICAQTRLQAFNLIDIRKLTKYDDLKLDEIGDKKIALFCITPTEEKSFNFLIALMYTQLFQMLYRKAENSVEGRLKIHTRFMLDEFANIGRIPDFPEKLSTMRKFEISCTIVLQALSQIKSMYKDEWEILLSNCDSMLYLGTNDATTNKYISEALGKETIRAVNSSISKGRQGSYSQSYNKTGRDLMTPAELKKLPNKDCIYFMRGYDPFYDQKYDITMHPRYKELGEKQHITKEKNKMTVWIPNILINIRRKKKSD